MKRSLIPIIGKGLSYLFGTAIEADSNTICSSFGRLAESQEEIAHVTDENILVNKITIVEITENRKALNKIIGSLTNLDVKLGNITQGLEKEVFQVGQFVKLYWHLDSYMQDTGNKENSLASTFLCKACTVTIKTCSQWDIFHHQSSLKEVWSFAIRNRESFTKAFKVIVWPKRRDSEVVSDPLLVSQFLIRVNFW